MSGHTNSQGEYISIETAKAEPFAGQPLLVIHDDPPHRGGTGTKAPMLLDEGTRLWLIDQLNSLGTPAASLAGERTT